MAERKQFPSEKQDQYMLRLPDGMRDRLKEEAAKSKRSLNAEIIARSQLSPDPATERATRLSCSDMISSL